MDFKRERMVDCYKEISKIADAHYDESAPNKDIKLDVDWEAYIRAEKAGRLVLYTVRFSGVLYGYSFYLVHYPVEYSGSLQASMLNIFISKSKRGRGTEFIGWCDDQLRELGVQVVYHHVKCFNDYGKILDRIGYEKINIEYMKRLDKE